MVGREQKMQAHKMTVITMSLATERYRNIPETRQTHSHKKKEKKKQKNTRIQIGDDVEIVKLWAQPPRFFSVALVA